jgi:cell division protein ZapA
VAQVDVDINGRSYQIACDDGQEAHLTRLSGYLDTRIKELVAAVGQVGDARLLVMAGLLIADELSDAYKELEAAGATSGEAKGEAEELLGSGIEALAQKIEGLAERLEGN